VSLLGRILERRDLSSFGPYPDDPSRIPRNGETYSNLSGVAVTEDTALRLSTVWACVRLLADSIASLPWAAFMPDGDDRARLDPQPSLLRAPFDDLTRFDWVHMLVVSLVLRGNFFGLITARDYREFPTEIMPLHPDTSGWSATLRAGSATGCRRAIRSPRRHPAHPPLPSGRRRRQPVARAGRPRVDRPRPRCPVVRRPLVR
jgi:hypothetical protein